MKIFVEGEEWEIMRGTWYYDGSWIPLETEHSKVIEEVHLKLFQKESVNQNITTCDTNTPQSYKGTLFIPLYFFDFLKLSVMHMCMYGFNIKVFLNVFLLFSCCVFSVTYRAVSRISRRLAFNQ